MYQGTDLRRLSGAVWELFRRNVQAIFQDPFAVYNPYYPVDHVLSVPIAKFGLAKTRAQARAKMEEALLGWIASRRDLGAIPSAEQRAIAACDRGACAPPAAAHSRG